MDDGRKGEIALIFLGCRIGREGIRRLTPDIKRELGNVAKATRILHVQMMAKIIKALKKYGTI